MPDNPASNRTSNRKAEHISVSLGQQVEAAVDPGWDDVVLVHRSLPEINRDDTDLSTRFLGKTLGAPLVIAALTGGSAASEEINRRLARAAQHYGLAMGVGSQRPYLEQTDLAAGYRLVRQEAPDALLIANIGAPQLISQDGRPAFGAADIRRATELIGADALAVHLNFLQEAAQSEGETHAAGCAEAIRHLAGEIGVPVIAKETGAGISREQASIFRDLGVAALDVGGAGGTSMALIEAHRSAARGDRRVEELARLFAGWGIPSAASVLECRTAGLPVIATGGVRTGLDAARAIALGATAVGVALPLLRAASESYERVEEWVEGFLDGLRTAMFLVGAATVDELRTREVVLLGRTFQWAQQRGLLD